MFKVIKNYQPQNFKFLTYINFNFFEEMFVTRLKICCVLHIIENDCKEPIEMVFEIFGKEEDVDKYSNIMIQNPSIFFDIINNYYQNRKLRIHHKLFSYSKFFYTNEEFQDNLKIIASTNKKNKDNTYKNDDISSRNFIINTDLFLKGNKDYPEKSVFEFKLRTDSFNSLIFYNTNYKNYNLIFLFYSDLCLHEHFKSGEFRHRNFNPKSTVESSSDKSSVTCGNYIVDNYNLHDYFFDLSYKITLANHSLIATCNYFLEDCYSVEKDKFKKQIEVQAEKNAETQIIARNFAHHLGSHVMPRVKFNDIRNKWKELDDDKVDRDNLTDEKLIKFIEFAKESLDDYITNRNEFIAEPETPHNSYLLFSQVLLPFINNTLLIDNICKSEGIGFKKDNDKGRLILVVTINNQRIYTQYEDGTTSDGNYEKGIITKPMKYDSIIDNNKAKVEGVLNGTDVFVSLPSPDVIYSILENIIRNAAKHNKDKLSGKDLIIEIRLNDNDDDSFYLNISDNVSNVSDDFNLKKQIKIFDKETMEPMLSNLGILELKIMARLVTGKERIISLSDDEFDIQILNDEGNEFHDVQTGKLNYRFKVYKPKDICFIGFEDPKNKNFQTFDFKNDFDEYLKKENSPAPYKFVVINENKITGDLNTELMKKLPFRTLIYSDKKSENIFYNSEQYFKKYVIIKDLDLNKSKDGILEKCWESWLGARFGLSEDKKAELLIHTEDKKDGLFKSDDTKLAFLYYQYDYNGLQSSSKALDLKSYPKVFFDHHGGFPINLLSDLNPKQCLISQNAYMRFGKNSKDFLPIVKADVNENKFMLYEILESGLAKILIIDERFIEIASQTNYTEGLQRLASIGGFLYKNETDNFKKCKLQKQLKNIDLYWAANVYVATHLNNEPIKNELFSNQENDHYLKIKIKHENEDYKLKTLSNHAILNKWNESNKFDITSAQIEEMQYDVVILHRTFLNETSINKYWKIKDKNIKTEKDVVALLNKFIPLVVIDSGGSERLGIDENYKFVSFNKLKENLFYPEDMGKYSLIKNLFTIRS